MHRGVTEGWRLVAWMRHVSFQSQWQLRGGLRRPHAGHHAPKLLPMPENEVNSPAGQILPSILSSSEHRFQAFAIGRQAITCGLSSAILLS